LRARATIQSTMRGNIRQRAKGTWTIQVYLGEDSVTGKKRYLSRTVKGTKKEAELALAKLIQATESGLDFDATRLTLETFAERWLANVEPRVRPKTHHRYAELFRIHIIPVIGRIRLDKLQPLHLERVYEEAFKKGRSAQTVLHIHRLLYTALRQAVAWQLLSRNVAEAVTAPRPEPRDVEPLTKEGVLTLLGAVRGTELEVPTVLSLGTGLRMGEVLGLRWKDVDLDEGRARVVQTIQQSPEGPIVVPPKTHRSRRIVLLPTFVVQTLKRHKANQAERRLATGAAWVDNDLVVERGDGQPMLTRVLSRRFSTAARKAGLELTFHGLRHGHATLMLAAGVNLKVVSERLGHSTIGITADLYTHVAEEVHRQAANSLDSWWRTALSQED
jgi:integrase